ncbi:MAG: ABC transporter permease, partial [Fimbriimonas sp.]
VMLLPSSLASQLKIDPRDAGKAKVNFAGTDYTVIGLVDPAILRSIQDLDGDGILPPDFSLSRRFQEESSSSNQAFRSYLRLDPGSCFILPVERSIDLGGELRTLAVAFQDPSQTRRSLENLMPRIRMNLYASVPKVAGSTDLQVRQFSVFQASKGTGIALILVQLAIAAVFVLNTMVASVYERTKEIAIFSSIGLAPNHIAMLFFAESLVYGVLGAVTGYILAQASAKIIVATNSLQGLYLNFSSTSAVLSAVLVMGVVLGSTIYPARKASQIAAPAMNDEVLKSEPEGDDWLMELPFSVNSSEAAPIIAFLGSWLKAYEEYTIGDFVTAGTTMVALPDNRYQVETEMWLAPYDLGISHKLTLTATPSKIAPGVYLLDLELKRLAGDPENWPVVSRRFLASLRKQFLTWRTLESSQRDGYRERAEVMFTNEPTTTQS